MVGDKLSAALNQQIVIDNRPGGGGNIGTRAVAKAEPDGYTLLLGHTGTISINPSLYANAGYDSRKDFAPVGLIAQMPVVLLTHPSVPVKSVPDLIALAKKEPGKLNIGTSTIGSGGYLSAQLFKSMAGVDMTIVPYKGTAPLASDLVGGHVPVAFNMLSPTLGNIRAGNLRALAVASATRTALLPDVPTVAESGLPDFEAVLHYGLLAPVGTPRFIVDRLNKELRTAVNSEDVRKRIASEGGDPLASTPEEYAADIDREEAKWAALVRRLGLKVE
jgi:tripartite-type tricarboxylate transporter receptor subunit TctC